MTYNVLAGLRVSPTSCGIWQLWLSKHIARIELFGYPNGLLTAKIVQQIKYNKNAA